MMIRFKRLLACGAAVIGLTAFGDTVLTQDEDWRGHESEKLTGTIDLNGHNLTISAFPTSATVTDTTGYTDLTEPGGVISVNLPEGGSESLVNLIDNDAASRVLLSGFKGCKINYDFGEGQSKVVRGFRFKAGNKDYSGRRPKSVVVYGTQDVVPDAAAAEKANWTQISDKIAFGLQPNNAWSICMAFHNETAYRAYRLEIDDNIGTDKFGDFLELYEMELIENVSPGGELHVVVESGAEVQNTTVSLKGTLKLVKDGAGTFKPVKTQSYEGGTEIVGGTVFMNSVWGDDSHPLGPNGSSIAIDEGGTFDLGAGQKYHVYKFYLNGGQIIGSLTGYENWHKHPMLGYVYLDADATMESTHSGGKALGLSADAAELWLNGHTLDLTMTGSYLKNLTVKSAGVINLHGVCEVPSSSGFCDLTLAELNAYGTLYLNGTLNLGDYINYLTAADSKSQMGTGNLYVHGRFKPVGDGFRGCTLKDGATLDLSGCTGTWDTKSKSTQSGSKEVLFEDGATITLDAGERTFENGEMIVSWTTPPQNVTFTPVADLGGELTPLANGLVLIAAGSVATEWTGNGDGKTWSQDANWSRNAPEVNGTAAFNQGAGTLDFDKGFILDLLTIGADAGAFTHAGTETLGVQSAITNLSAAAQAFSMPMALGKSGEAFQVHTVGALTITSGSDTCAATELVKTGAGELTVDDLVVHTAKNVTVDEGALHIIPTSAAKAKTDGTGAIRVADGAQLLLDANNGGDSLAVVEPTRGKTVYIAGDGGDGRGAIYNIQNTDSKGSWAGYLSRLVLTDDASVGGGHIGVRPNTSSGITDSRTEGAGTLTVKTVETAASGFTFHTTQFALGGLVNAGLMQFEDNVSGTITNGVQLADGSTTALNAATVGTGISAIVAPEATATLRGKSNASTFNGAVSVPSGSTLVVSGDKAITFTGGFTNEGTIRSTTSQPVLLNGACSGSGTFESTAGTLDIGSTFSGGGFTGSFTVSGGSLRFGKGGALPLSLPTFNGVNAGVVLCPSATTTVDGQYDAIVAQAKSVDVQTDVAGTDVVLGDANWSVAKLSVGAGARFVQNGGTLAVGKDGINATMAAKTPTVVLNAGMLKPTANFKNGYSVQTTFGETSETAGDYTIDLDGKTVDWVTALRGYGNVLLTGTGSFSSGVASDITLQAFVAGDWTVDANVTANLTGAAGFVGDLTVREGAKATITMDEGLVEYGMFDKGTVAYEDSSLASIKAYADSYPYLTRSLAKLHKYYSNNSGPINNCHFCWRGQFYVDADHADKVWYFAGAYDDRLLLEIDGVQVFFVNASNVAVAGKTADPLAEGWHDFRILAYDGTGAQGATVSDWKNAGMALGWTTDDPAADSKKAAKYTKFDETTLAFRLRSPQNVVRWASKSGYSTLDTVPFGGTSCGTFDTLKFLRTKNNAELTAIAKGNKAAQLTGWFYAEASGAYAFTGNFDDWIALFIDGVRVLKSPSGCAKAEGTATLAAGWHQFDIRVSDNSGDVGTANALVVKRPGDSAAVNFDEEYFTLRTDAPGLFGVTTLAAGAELTNTADGACPIHGMLAGTGALKGNFAFAADGCWQVRLGRTKSQVKAADVAGVTNADFLKALGRVDVVLEDEAGAAFYPICGAGSLTSDDAARIAVTVSSSDGAEVRQGWTATVRNGVFGVVNPKPAGLLILFQ